jgi:hypothetical protein
VRRLLPLTAALALVLVGCEASTVDRAASVTVSGRILQPDGSRAAGVVVALQSELSAGEFLAGVVVVPLTLFTACLADPPPELCRGRTVRRVTTAADGTYSFRLTGKDVQAAFGNARRMSVTAEVAPAPGEVAGAAVVAAFKVQTENLALHDLRLWQPKVTVGPGKAGWDGLAGSTAYQVAVEDAAGQPVWSFDANRPEVTFDPRLLEDTAGTLAVSVRGKDTAEGTTVDVYRRSGRVGYRSTAGPPVSRGKPCGVSPCLLTDGDFSTRLPPPPTTTSTTAPTPASATIDLGQARDVSLVVVRGCTCQVDGSPDGQGWAPLGRSTGLAAVTPARTAQVRFVRVTGSLSDLREVSVWDGPAPRR